jgi:hypothetical protein
MVDEHASFKNTFTIPFSFTAANSTFELTFYAQLLMVTLKFIFTRKVISELPVGNM